MKKHKEVITSLLVIAYFWYCAKTYPDWHFIDGVDLIFHEAGHTIFSFFGLYIKILAGSAFQVLLPLAIALYFFITKQRISGSLTLLWVGQNLLNVSIYARDAIMMELNLLGGDGVFHDWNYILSEAGKLGQAPVIADRIYNAGILFIALGTALALYFSIRADYARRKIKHEIWLGEDTPERVPVVREATPFYKPPVTETKEIEEPEVKEEVKQ